MDRARAELPSRTQETCRAFARRLLVERTILSALLAVAAFGFPGGARLAAWVLALGVGSAGLLAAAYHSLGARHARRLAWAGLALDLALISAFVYATGGAASPGFALYLTVFRTPFVFDEPRGRGIAGGLAAAAFVLTSALHTLPLPPERMLVQLTVLGLTTAVGARLRIAREALVRELDRRVAELAAINSVAHEVTAILNPDALTWRVVELVRERFGYARAWIALRDGERLTVRTAGGRVVETWMLDGSTLLGEATRTGQVVQRAPEGTRPARLAVPLVVGAHAIGALEVEAAPGVALGPRDLRSLEAVAAFTAIALENAQLHQSAVRSALTDPLTGLFNVRYLQEMLGRALARSAAAGRPFSLLVLDVDNLREVNNQHGHPAGDAALREVARVIATAIRGGDIAARYGGDEFLLALVDTGPEAAAAVAERVRREVQRIRLVHAGRPVPVSVSIGVASHPLDGGTLDALLEAADRAAYRAKSQGRNRVAFAGDPVAGGQVSRSAPAAGASARPDGLSPLRPAPLPPRESHSG
ncbi:MAG TPA: sensor domain-containing diguanylate cyclase [Thermodesulfobacteriota bacterium]|nr:sensor domain-containing diguanylate cyclase [Thermodesulfobacteriota bacterium]